MKRGEEGFTMIETVVATGLLAIATTGFMGTTLAALHVVNQARANDAMDVIAHNALVDLYAASAYDKEAATLLVGQTRTSRVNGYTVSVRAYTGEQGAVEATVSVSDALGAGTVMHGLLAQAGPAPGSAITPAPPAR